MNDCNLKKFSIFTINDDSIYDV